MIKGALTKLILIVGIGSLVACSSNTPNQNAGMAVGAVAGGLLGSTIGGGAGKAVAIGVGAVAGALIGGAIGKSMDDSDRMKMAQAMHNSPGQPSYWKNTRTGAVYRVVPMKRVTVNGNPNCREYRTTAIINGKKQRVYGVACPMANGTWQTVSG